MVLTIQPLTHSSASLSAKLLGPKQQESWSPSKVLSFCNVLNVMLITHCTATMLLSTNIFLLPELTQESLLSVTLSIIFDLLIAEG